MSFKNKSKLTHAQHVFKSSRYDHIIFDEKLRKSDGLRDMIDETTGIIGKNTKVFCNEVFSRLFSDPERLDNPECHAWEVAAHNVLETKEFEQLKKAVIGDRDFALLAAKGVVNDLTPHLHDICEDAMKSESQKNDEKHLGASKTEIATAKMKRKVRESIKKVSEAKEFLDECLPQGSSGVGSDTSEGDEKANGNIRYRMIEMYSNNKTLKLIMDLTGRMVRARSQKQKVSTSDFQTEVVDVELGGNITRILPSEIAALKNPKLRKMTIAKILDRKALQYKLVGKEAKGKGPIVVIRDVSGSMRGYPDFMASTITAALSVMARKEKRDFIVIRFESSVVDAVLRTDEHGSNYILEGNDWPREEEGIEWRYTGCNPGVSLLEYAKWGACRGGTDLNYALSYYINLCKLSHERFKRGVRMGIVDQRSDVILITDGCCDHVTEGVINDILKKKEQDGLHIAGILVNNGELAPAVADVCDTICAVDVDKAFNVADSEDDGAAANYLASCLNLLPQ